MLQAMTSRFTGLKPATLFTIAANDFRAQEKEERCRGRKDDHGHQRLLIHALLSYEDIGVAQRQKEQDVF